MAIRGMIEESIPPISTQDSPLSGDLANTLKQHNLLIIGVIIVLFIGFASAFIAVGGLIVNYESDRQATYKNLENQVQAQNTQIQVLTNQIKNSTISPK
jgi:hypothetical protein